VIDAHEVRLKAYRPRRKCDRRDAAELREGLRRGIYRTRVHVPPLAIASPLPGDAAGDGAATMVRVGGVAVLIRHRVEAVDAGDRSCLGADAVDQAPAPDRHRGNLPALTGISYDTSVDQGPGPRMSLAGGVA
jgi:hypothetical protein